MKPNTNDYKVYKPEHDLERLKIQSFLTDFYDNYIEEDEKYGKKKYMIELVNSKIKKYKII